MVIRISIPLRDQLPENQFRLIRHDCVAVYDFMSNPVQFEYIKSGRSDTNVVHLVHCMHMCL